MAAPEVDLLMADPPGSAAPGVAPFDFDAPTDGGGGGGGDDSAGESNGDSESAGESDGEGPAVPAVPAGGADAAPGWEQLSKKEAKRQLPKAEYKQWKKQYGKKKDKKKDKKKGKKKSKEKEKKEKNKKEKKKRDSKKEPKTGVTNSPGRLTAALKLPRAPKEPKEPRVPRVAKKSPAKLSDEEQRRTAAQAAAELVRRMAEARLADAAAAARGSPPLHRVGLVRDVTALGRRAALHQALVAAGFLREISGWLCSARGLAPLDLRDAALEVLLGLALEGVAGGHRPRGRPGARYDDLEAWDGVAPEALRASPLGYAVNFVRQHSRESPGNRARATRLLQRFSQALAGGDDEEGAPAADGDGVTWPSRGDPGVLPPFEALPTSSEVFAAKRARVNPLDPSSYFRQPPPRLQGTYITCMYPLAPGGGGTRRCDDDLE